MLFRSIPLRVLGFRKDAAHVLTALSQNAALLTKPADYRQLDNVSQEIFAKEIQATDIHSLLCGLPAGRDFSQGVVMV